jgi:hypothetical protein
MHGLVSKVVPEDQLEIEVCIIAIVLCCQVSGIGAIMRT